MKFESYGTCLSRVDVQIWAERIIQTKGCCRISHLPFSVRGQMSGLMWENKNRPTFWWLKKWTKNFKYKKLFFWNEGYKYWYAGHSGCIFILLWGCTFIPSCMHALLLSLSLACDACDSIFVVLASWLVYSGVLPKEVMVKISAVVSDILFVTLQP